MIQQASPHLSTYIHAVAFFPPSCSLTQICLPINLTPALSHLPHKLLPDLCTQGTNLSSNLRVSIYYVPLSKLFNFSESHLLICNIGLIRPTSGVVVRTGLSHTGADMYQMIVKCYLSLRISTKRSFF